MNIEQLMKEFGPYIYNYALKLTCHPIDAEDLSQETFVNAWKHLGELKSDRAVKKWLTKICYNLFLIKIRQSARYKEELIEDYEKMEQEDLLLSSNYPEPEEEVIVEEEIREFQNDCFLAMVRKLTLNQRIVFSLVDMYGMKIEEVAPLLGISLLATKSLLHRARMNMDSFFASHSNLIYSKNLSNCKAWTEYFKKRERLKATTKLLIEKLKYKEKNYQYLSEVRKKIYYLYSTMPEHRPNDKWFQSVLKAFI
jgi:RNA polymerase sigma factor (sigma-70 family)